MAVDVVAGIYSRLATLLLAEPTFYSGPGGAAVRSLVRYDGDNGYPRKDTVQPQDLPEAELDYESGQFSETEPMLHYGTGDASTDAYSLLTAHHFVVTLTIDDLRISKANSLVNGARLALRKAGNDLGLSYVHKWGPIMRADRLSDGGDDAGRGHRRRIVMLGIAVETVQQSIPEAS